MSDNPNELFELARRAFAEKQLSTCSELVERLKAVIGPHPAALHLEALCAAEAGRTLAAQTAFQTAIARSDGSPEPALLANFGRFLWSQMDWEGAREILARAAQSAPEDGSIQAMHISALRQREGDGAAEEEYDAIQKRRPDDAQMWHYKALFLRDAGLQSKALPAVRRALELNSASHTARHLEARLLLELGQPSEAGFAACHSARPHDEDVVCGWAAAKYQAGDCEAAFALLDDFVGKSATPYKAIEARLGMTHQAKSPQDALGWIIGLCERRSDDRDLARLRNDFVWRTDGAHAALAHMDTGELGEGLADNLQCAQILSDAGEFGRADAIFDMLESLLAHAPAQLRMARPVHLLRSGRMSEAIEKAHLLAQQTNLIEAWAYVEAGWRAMADPRWDWLMAGGELIQHFELSGFAAYQRDLVSDLNVLHDRLTNQPYEQSVRGGTQTDGFLLGRSDEAIAQLRSDLDQAIGYYIRRLGKVSDDHPLAKLRHAHPRIVGSWSVRLRSAGKHAPHFHSQGLLSSACYVALPHCMEANGTNEMKAGWIEFGRPPENSGLPDGAFSEIQPKEGRLVLFPSFLFHATRPFPDGERLTVAFDVGDIML